MDINLKKIIFVVLMLFLLKISVGDIIYDNFQDSKNTKIMKSRTPAQER